MGRKVSPVCSIEEEYYSEAERYNENRGKRIRADRVPEAFEFLGRSIAPVIASDYEALKMIGRCELLG